MQHDEDNSDALSIQSSSTMDSRQPQKEESLTNLIERVYRRQLALHIKISGLIKVLNLKETHDRACS